MLGFPTKETMYVLTIDSVIYVLTGMFEPIIIYYKIESMK